MQELSFRASEVCQGDLKFYATSIPIKQALSEGFYTIDVLDPNTGDGYQRVLEESRARKIAGYILDNIDNPKGVFIPTAIFAATEKPIIYKDEESSIIFSEDVLPFNIVDGQHRLEGFKRAAEKDERVLDLDIAFNICGSMPMLHQMCHFYIVNTTQKKVNEAIGQQIIARLSHEYELRDTPPLPTWMSNLVKSGSIEKGLEVAKFLNKDPASPWKDKIIMANAPRKGGIIHQATFVKSVQKHLISPSNPVTHKFRDDFDKQCRAFLNYWCAVYEVIQPEDNSVFFKSTGAEIFNQFSITVFDKLLNQRTLTQQAIETLFREMFANMDGDYAEIQSADWWKSGGEASSVNAAGFSKIINEMKAGLYEYTSDGGGDLFEGK